MITSVLTDTKTNGLIIRFAVKDNCTVSLALFDLHDVLITTIFSGKKLKAGNHQYIWDKNDVTGLQVKAGKYKIKLLTNNVAAVWEGVIGNSSKESHGATKHGGYIFYQDMCIAGNFMYLTNRYNEGRLKDFKINLNSPNERQYALPLTSDKRQYGSPDTKRLCTDGVRIYRAAFGNIGAKGKLTDAYQHFIFATLVENDEYYQFPAGEKITLDRFNTGTYSAISVENVTDTNDEKIFSDIAVQPTGNFLFQSSYSSNTIKVFNKVSGQLVNTNKLIGPERMCCDIANNLWVTFPGKNTVKKFVAKSNGTLEDSGTHLSGFSQIKDICTNRNGNKLFVTDGDNSQQVKLYDTKKLSLILEKGRKGGYGNDVNVSNEVFFFGENASIAVEKDDSFWVLDDGLNRLLKYNADGVYQDYIMYLPRNRAVAIHANNNTRLFSEFLEFKIDYSKPLSPSNHSWKLVKNWLVGMQAYENEFVGIQNPVTLANGKTYCICQKKDKPRELVELSDMGKAIPTGLSFDFDLTLKPEGIYSLEREMKDKREEVRWVYYAFNGFDSKGLPIVLPKQVIAETYRQENDPITLTYFTNNYGEINGDLILCFDNTEGKFSNQSQGYHLGAFNLAAQHWQWRTSYRTGAKYTGDFPEDERFENGNGTNYAGSNAKWVGDFAIYGHHGEFWKGGQTNEYKMFYKNGIYVTGFGTNTEETKKGSDSYYPPKMAGNALNVLVTKVGDYIKLYHGDEGWHNGLHSWKITGLDTISVSEKELTISNNIARSFLEGEIDLMEGLPVDAQMLGDGMGGWRRFPATDYNTGFPHFWELKCGSKSLFERNIYSVFAGRNGENVRIEKRIEINVLATWRLSFGYLNESTPVTTLFNHTGHIIQLQDNNEKIIFELDYRFIGPNIAPAYEDAIFFNKQKIVNFLSKRSIVQSRQSVNVVFDGKFLTVDYYNNFVQTSVLETGANAKQPAKFILKAGQEGDYHQIFSAAIFDLKLYTDQRQKESNNALNRLI